MVENLGKIVKKWLWSYPSPPSGGILLKMIIILV